MTTSSQLSALSLERLLDLSGAVDGTLSAIYKIDINRFIRGVENKISADYTKAFTGTAAAGLDEHFGKMFATGMPEANQIDVFVKNMGVKLKTPLTARQVGILQGRLKNIYEQSKKATSAGIKARASFALRDVRAAKAIARHQVFWVGNFFNDELSQRIRGVSRDVILNQGLGIREAGKELRRTLEREMGIISGGKTGFAPSIPARYAGNPDLYYQQLASVGTQQARVFSKVEAYADAGVVSYRISNPNDTRTGTICQQMVDQVFTVSAATKHVDRMTSAKSPEAIKEVQPWINGKEIEESLGGAAVGSPDATKILEDSGAILPPFHPLCRSEPVVLNQPRVAPAPQPIPRGVPRPQEALPRKGAVDPALSMMLRSKAVKSSSGESVPLDGPSIENHDVRFRVENIGGKDVMRARMKVTPQESENVEAALRRLGGSDKRWKPHRRGHYGPDGKIIKGGAKGDFEFNAVGGRVGGVEINMVTENGALKNFLEIRVIGGDVEKGFKAVTDALAKLGIKDPNKLPSEVFSKMLRQARIMTQWDAAAWRELGALKNLTPELVDAIFKRAATRNPELKKILSDMQLTRPAKGHSAFHSKAQAKYMRDRVGVDHMYHDLADPDALVAILSDANGSGLLSSVERFDRGVFKQGMSTPRDFSTGGADGVFVRLSKDRPLGNSARVIIDPDQLGRSDWYFFNFDNFGRAGPGDFGQRKLIPRMKGLQLNGGNEAVFQHGIPVEAMKKVIVSYPPNRIRILAELKKKGITKINGKPINKFIVGE